SGRIAAVGRSLAVPLGTHIVEAAGRPVTPGVFGGVGGLGIDETVTGDSRLTLGSPQEPQFVAEFDVTRAFNPRSFTIPIARVEGITWTMLAPDAGGSFVAGQGGAVTLDGTAQVAMANSRTLFIDLGADVAALSGGSRAGQLLLLEQAIAQTRKPSSSEQSELLSTAGRAAFRTYLDGGRVVAQVDRATDISQCIAFAQRVGFKLVIIGGAEAWLVADEMAAAGVPVILDPLQNLPGNFDSLNARLDNAALLQRAGVLIAFTVPNAAFDARKILQSAGNAVTQGLDWHSALTAVTANPARIFGVSHLRGSIAVGKVADLVLWSGDPLDVTSVAEQVWIGGRALEMRSRQSELRDRYLKLAEQRESLGVSK
ncbi:amidohydrolase family protein, partial [Steroidobacter sp.]|uniref:amidohydrolase family protein n=1 Tax=Steroidobacter sp. TaxID=1978227 RepID=UPI001A437DDD